MSRIPPPALGDTAPDLDLQDTEGRTVRLSELAKKSGKLVVIFYRGHW